MREIYLDNAATTRVSEEAAELALRLMRVAYGNPSSLHSKGLEADRLLQEARGRVAEALGCADEEVVFTSGGTEANNLAILGAARAMRRRGKTIVTTQVEHSSVLEPVRFLEQEGWTVKYLPPRPDGGVDASAVLDAVDGDTVLVSCMYVNSEVGSVLPIREIATGLKRKKSAALFHTDAVQAFGKLSLTVRNLGVDLLTVSGHKIHAPKGCGALYIRKGTRVLPVLHGGGQENNLRSGTESTPLCCAFGLAAESARKTLWERYEAMERLQSYLLKKAREFEGLCINSPPDGTPYIWNVSLPGYRSQPMLNYFAERGIYLSSGSACSKGAKSHILKAMGLPDGLVDSALRLSFSEDNTTEDADAFFDALNGIRREMTRK